MAARQKILILDDEHDILEIYQEILARLPSQPEIHTADAGARAIALLESEPFNLLLVDLRMPIMDGFQVLAIVRRRFPTLRVVVMTAAEDEQFRARAYAMGIDLYLEKPKTGKEIINFVDCIESMLEKEDAGGFRGVQSKTLVDIVQLECLTQSSAILKISSAIGDGRIWIQKGEIIDAACGELLGKDAFLEMLRWKAGSFEILPNDTPRPRTIFSSYENLLMETAQTLDEAEAEDAAGGEASSLASFSRYKGVQFVIAVEGADKTKFEHWATENPDRMAAWIHQTTRALRTLGDKLEAGHLESLEALGPQRHVAILASDDQYLGIGFTRSAALPHIRETMKQIEAKWAFLKPFSRQQKTLRPERLPSGCFTLHRGGGLASSTLPSSFSRETILEVGREVLRIFSSAQDANLALTDLHLNFSGLTITARELRGGALIFLQPATMQLPHTHTPPAMHYKNIEEFILHLENYIECWKQFNHYVNLARDKKFAREDEVQFLELKSVIAQGLEAIIATTEKGGPKKEEVHHLFAQAPSLRYLADAPDSIPSVEGAWHKTYLGLQSLLGQLKVQQNKAEKGTGWSLFGRSK